MEENKEKELERFVQKTIKEVGLEEPSANFTHSVLSKIQLNVQERAVRHKPLISKSTWGVLTALVTGIFAYLILGNPKVEIPWLSSQKFEMSVNMDFVDALADLQLSNTFVYSLVGLVFFLGVQVVLLKNHIERRYILD